MTAWVSIAIIILAIVVLILGAPFALNEYSRYQERQEQPITTVTSVITTPAINPDPNIFNTHWCRKEGVFRRCYQLFPDHSYSYGSDDTHAEVIMPDKWVLISQNKYLIPDPLQTFSYLDGRLFTSWNPSYGPLTQDQDGLVRQRA